MPSDAGKIGDAKDLSGEDFNSNDKKDIKWHREEGIRFTSSPLRGNQQQIDNPSGSGQSKTDGDPSDDEKTIVIEQPQSVNPTVSDKGTNKSTERKGILKQGQERTPGKNYKVRFADQEFEKNLDSTYEELSYKDKLGLKATYGIVTDIKEKLGAVQHLDIPEVKEISTDFNRLGVEYKRMVELLDEIAIQVYIDRQMEISEICSGKINYASKEEKKANREKLQREVEKLQREVPEMYYRTLKKISPNDELQDILIRLEEVCRKHSIITAARKKINTNLRS
jgi:hypothetical protein